jgi:Rps23 Pro-64 3,4-dihydroxylase Tpa1-like proline 4-hydroxylase
MLDLTRSFEHVAHPFTLHLAQRLLTCEQLRELAATAPIGAVTRIEKTDPKREKQYAMNIFYLLEDGRKCQATEELSAAWAQLLDDLCSDAFLDWLEAGTKLKLRHLATDIAVYTHQDGDYISVHKDKPTKAITGILYLNEEWPPECGGFYEARQSGDPRVDPVRCIPPQGGQFLAFPPTDRSWHSVSEVKTGGTATRLTVQVEYWFERPELVSSP